MKFSRIALVVLLMAACVAPVRAQIAVIVNKGVEMDISSAQKITDVYTLDIQKSKNGVPLVVFDVKVADLKKAFYAALGKTATELKRTWMKAQLSGDGKAPEALESEQDVVAKVAATPGGVGYVKKEHVTDAVNVLFEIQ